MNSANRVRPPPHASSADTGEVNWATLAFDRRGMCKSAALPGASSAYGYDGAGRPSSLCHDLRGVAVVHDHEEIHFQKDIETQALVAELDHLTEKVRLRFENRRI